jgi:hypothetical protein
MCCRNARHAPSWASNTTPDTPGVTLETTETPSAPTEPVHHQLPHLNPGAVEAIAKAPVRERVVYSNPANTTQNGRLPKVAGSSDENGHHGSKRSFLCPNPVVDSVFGVIPGREKV